MSWQTLAQEHNLDISIVKLTDIEGLFRIEAEFYNPHFLSKRQTLLNKKTQNLVDIAKLVSGPAYSSEAIAETFDENSIPIVKIGDVTNKRPLENLNYLSKKEFEKFGSSGVNEWDILMTMTGDPPDVGKCNIWQVKKGQVLAFNQRVCKITTKKGVSPLVLFAYLSTEYARCFSERYAMGIRQRNVSIKDIRNIPVPVFSNNLAAEIEKNISNHFSLLENSKSEYREAEQLLLKETNLAGYKPSEENISVRSFSESLADNRFDAEYWQPKYDEIEKRVSAIPQKELDSIVSMKKGVEPGSEAYHEEGKSFIRVSDFTVYGIENAEKKISEELYEELKKSYKPQKGEVLFTKDGTIGISFALHDEIDAIVSGAFLRLKPKIKINTDYLALTLNSIYCKAQIERMSGGAIIAHLKPDNVKKIKIPMLAEKKQQELADKASNSFQLQQEAKNILEKTKRAVEIFIEQDEKQALAYLNK